MGSTEITRTLTLPLSFFTRAEPNSSIKTGKNILAYYSAHKKKIYIKPENRDQVKKFLNASIDSDGIWHFKVKNGCCGDENKDEEKNKEKTDDEKEEEQKKQQEKEKDEEENDDKDDDNKEKEKDDDEKKEEEKEAKEEDPKEQDPHYEPELWDIRIIQDRECVTTTLRWDCTPTSWIEPPYYMKGDPVEYGTCTKVAPQLCEETYMIVVPKGHITFYEDDKCTKAANLIYEISDWVCLGN